MDVTSCSHVCGNELALFQLAQQLLSPQSLPLSVLWTVIQLGGCSEHKMREKVNFLSGVASSITIKVLVCAQCDEHRCFCFHFFSTVVFVCVGIKN